MGDSNISGERRIIEDCKTCIPARVKQNSVEKNVDRVACNLFNRQGFGRENPRKTRLLSATLIFSVASIAAVVVAMAWPAIAISIPLIGIITATHLLYTGAAAGGLALFLGLRCIYSQSETPPTSSLSNGSPSPSDAPSLILQSDPSGQGENPTSPEVPSDKTHLIPPTSSLSNGSSSPLDMPSSILPSDPSGQGGNTTSSVGPSDQTHSHLIPPESDDTNLQSIKNDFEQAKMTAEKAAQKITELGKTPFHMDHSENEDRARDQYRRASQSLTVLSAKVQKLIEERATEEIELLSLNIRQYLYNFSDNYGEILHSRSN